VLRYNFPHCDDSLFQVVIRTRQLKFTELTLPVNAMSVRNIIETKIRTELRPELLSIVNESHMHGGPATESHFKVTLVSDVFAGLPAVKRHQCVYGLLAEQLAGPVHALALHLYSPREWEQRGGSVPASPDCRGGSKAGG